MTAQRSTSPISRASSCSSPRPQHFAKRASPTQQTATSRWRSPPPTTWGSDATARSAISLRALGYALRVDAATLRTWVERGRLSPDYHAPLRNGESFCFRRDRVEQLRIQLGANPLPTTGAEWRQEFLDFALSRRLSRSYKPVLLKALLKLVDRNGEASLEALAAEVLAFYQGRFRHALPVEFGVPLLEDPTTTSLDAVEQLLVRNPLERFLIQGFLQFDSAARVVRFAPPLWSELRASELIELVARAHEQLAYYYARRA